MKRVIKRAVSLVLVFMTVFSVFTILPSEVFHTAYVKAAEMLSSATGTSSTETYTTDDFTYTLTDEYTKVQILSYIGSGTDVVIPDKIDNKKVASIADDAFYEKSITSVTFGKYVETIGSRAFKNDKSLKTVIFNGNSLKSIGEEAFYETAVTELNLSGDNASIGIRAFGGSSLKTVKLGAGISTIGGSAFSCESLTEIELSEDLTKIGNYAFYGASIENIVIPDKVTEIGDYAFQACKALKTVTIGKGCLSIASNAFIGTTAFEKFNVSADNKSYASVAGALCSKDITSIICYPAGKSGEFIVPDTVKSIEKDAFHYCYELTKVTIGSGVETIGSYAFEWCKSLKTVIFKDSDVAKKTIGYGAFQNCSSLTEVDFGNAVTSIEDFAFCACNLIKNLEFPDSLTYIGRYAFSVTSNRADWNLNGKGNIESVKFGKNLKTIGEYAFYYNSKISNLKFTGNSLTSIGEYAFCNAVSLTDLEISGNNLVIGGNAFYNCEELKSLNLKSGVKSIGKSAFGSCEALTDVKLCSGLETIDSYSFSYCKNIETITLPDTLTQIGSYAFNKCSSLQSIVIPDNVTEICENTFADCSSLKSISIGKSCTTIVPTAFGNTANLEEINVSEDNEKYTSVDGALLNKSKTSIILYPQSKSGEFVIPDTVTSVAERAFSGCKNLTKVTIGENVKNIGKYAFSKCSSLSEVIFKDSTGLTKTIEDEAFSNCSALTKIDFGNSVTSIGDYAFACDTSLVTIEFPDSLTTIGKRAFSSYSHDKDYESNIKRVKFGKGLKTIGNCAFSQNNNLENIEFTGNNLNSIGGEAFSYCTALTKVDFTGKDLTIGDSAFYGDSGLSTVNLGDDVIEIDGNAFSNCKSLKNVTIGKNCKIIKTGAFRNTAALEEINVSKDNAFCTSVDGVLYSKDKSILIRYPETKQGKFTVPDTVTEIEGYSFENSNLTAVKISDNVKTIHDYAFSGCVNLTSVTIGDGVTTIGYGAFYNCQSLTDVDFGNSVKSIDSYAFAMDTSLTSIEFPDSLESIAYRAFSPCDINNNENYSASSLKSVKFGKGLKTIGNYAFRKNEKLESIEFTGDNLNSIAYYSFSDCTALAKLNLTGNDLYIDSYAFYNNSGLKSVTLGKGVKNVSDRVFQNCTSLESVDIGNDVRYIGYYVFDNDPSLKKVVLGKGLSSINDSAFYNHKKFTVYCYEDTFGYTYAKGMSDVDIKLIPEDYYVVDLKTTAVAKNSMTISWNRPKGYESIDHYIIYKNGAKYDETTDLSYTDINLKSGEKYVYGVAAVDNEGIVSEEKTVSVTPACTSVKEITLPNNKTDIGGLNKIKLTATMESNLSKTGGQGEFQFSSVGNTWKSACMANVQSDGVSYVGYWSLQNVVTGEYSLRFVFTDKDGGQSYKNIKVNVDRTHPAPIDEVTITPMETYIALSWQLSVEYDTKIYRIYKRAENETNFELLSEIRNRDTTSYTDKKVEKDITYYYYIVGVDAYGQESLKYDIVSAGLINDIIPPQFINMTPASNNYIYGKQPFSVVASDNVGVTKTELYYSTNSEAPLESWTLFDSHNGSSYSQNIDTTVIPNGIVYVVAKIYDAFGNYTYSTTQKYMCDNQGPEQVKNVKCVAVAGTTATLSWSDVSDDDISYFVVECKQDDGTWESVSRTSTSLGVNLSGLAPEHDYVYRVIGYDRRSNRGVPSEEITVTTLKDTICPKVTKITPEPGYFNSEINLSFTTQDDYRVESIKIETSTDKENWKEVSEQNVSGKSAKYIFDYKLDLTDYKEGSIFVRAKVCDSYGNVTEDKDLTCYEYVVDRTAPVKPTGVTASSGETKGGLSFVNISWTPITDDSSFAYYRVYRSDSANGDFTLLKDNVKTVNKYDEDVDFGATYYYKIEAVDFAGNVSEQSDVVSCKVKNDTTKPVIYDLSPVDGTRISKNNNSITVAASDNARLSSLKVEYKTNGLFSSYKTLKEITDNSKNNCTVTVALPVDDLNSGTEVTLKVSASDSSGNEADEKIATYTIDKDAPEIKNLKLVEKDNDVLSLSWTSEADDISHFYIYRKRAYDKSYILYDSVIAESGKTSYTYNDDGIKASDKSVIYKIESYDKCDNTSSVESELLKLSGKIPPTPLLNCQSTVVVGSEYMYDATASIDDGKIVSYSFNFGDGTAVVKNENGKAFHIFKNSGKYKVTLSVTDNDGNTSKLTKEITVTNRDLVSTVSVCVKDNNGHVLSNTDAYMDLGEKTQQHRTTDSNGVAVFEVPIGTHVVSAYKDSNYLPVKQNVSVTSRQTFVTLVLTNAPIVTGDFEIHKMSFDEIVAAGIDINAAENRNVVRLDVTLIYDYQPIDSVIYWNGKRVVANPIFVKSSSGERKLTPNVTGDINHPTITYIDVPVEASYVKEFFSVSLHIINHSSRDFSLLDNRVTLNLPDGLSVVKTNSSASSASVYIDKIAGQTQKTVKWVLSGDKAGTYDISADFLGMLSYFNQPVSAKFKSANPIEVKGTSNIGVEIEASDRNTTRGKLLYNVVIRNNGDSALRSFKWESLDESFYDEYVDSRGNSSEMRKQRDILYPGEKFVYHCFTNAGGSTKYVDNIVEDFASMEGSVNVSLHKYDYFLDKYYEKFPEECGGYVVYVKDKNNNPISGATVELSSDFSRKTDEDGRVVIKKEEREDVITSYLKVELKGYYTYIDRDFRGRLFGSNEKVKIFRIGEFGASKVKIDGRDALNSFAAIRPTAKNPDGSSASVTFEAVVYGDIAKVDVMQRNRILTPKSRKKDSVDPIYTNVYKASDFSASDHVYLYVTLKSGIYEKVELLTRYYKTNEQFSFKFPERSNLYLTDCSVDWLNGFSMALDFKHTSGKTKYEGNGNYVFELEGNVGKKFEDFEKFTDVLPKLNFSVAGLIKINVSKGYPVVTKCSLTLKVTASSEFTGSTIVGYIPLTMTVKLKTSLSARVSSVRNNSTNKLEMDPINKLLIDIEPEIRAGVGEKNISTGIYGDAKFAFDVSIDKSVLLNTAKLSGNLGVYLKLCQYIAKFKILSTSVTLYDRNAKGKVKAYSELVAAAYDTDNYSVNDKLLSYNSGWNDEIESGNGSTPLLDNAYSALKPQIAVCGDKAVMVYQSVDENATNAANALALYYSIYDSTTGKWSKSEKLDNNKCADMSYSLAVCGDQIYLVYTQSNSELSDDVSIKDTLKNVDVYSAQFSFGTNKFENFTRISDNGTYDATPVLKDLNGVPTVVWMNSSSNNPFFNDSSNSIMTSSFINGNWSQPQALAQNIDAVINCDIIGSENSKYIVYTCDKDGDLSTTGDKTVYACNTNTGEINTLAENVETSVTTGKLLNKSVVAWYESGALMQYDIASQTKAKICDISSSAAENAEIVSDENGDCSIVYTEGKNKINAICLDTATGKWSSPVTFVSSDNYIENVEAEYINGKLTFTYYDSKVTDDEMNTESKLVTTVADSVSKPTITDANIDYSTVSAGKEVNAEVTVTNNSFDQTGNLTFTVTNYNGTVLGTYTTTDKSLLAGESEVFTVPFTAPEKIVNRCVTITVTDSKAKYTSSYDINLGYTDMEITAEQYIDGEDNFIKTTVSNNYSYDSPATVEVYNRNTNEIYYTQNLSYVSKDYPVVFNIPLDKSYVDDTGFVSVRVISKASDYYDFNNTDTFAYYDPDMYENMVMVGDTTLDGEINIVDATLVQKHIVNIETLEGNALVAADVDRDNLISIKDATLIQSYIVNSENCGYCGVYVNPSELPTVPTTVAPSTEPTTANKAYVYTKGYTYAYFWNDTNTKLAGAWPGKAMESIGNGVYRAEVPEGATNVIFSNKGANKTADLTVDVGKCYSDGVWSTYNP